MADPLITSAGQRQATVAELLAQVRTDVYISPLLAASLGGGGGGGPATWGQIEGDPEDQEDLMLLLEARAPVGHSHPTYETAIAGKEDKNPTQHFLDGGTVLTPGGWHWDNLTGNRAFTFSVAPAAGSLTGLYLIVSGGPHTITFPSAQRLNESGGPITQLTIPDGRHELTFRQVHSTELSVGDDVVSAGGGGGEGGPAEWGQIEGDIGDQEDLADLLAGKAPVAHGHAIGDIASLSATLDSLGSAINGKLPIANPAPTGNVDMSGAASVAVPTATAGDESTKAASTEFVQGEIASRRQHLGLKEVTNTYALILDDATSGDALSATGPSDVIIEIPNDGSVAFPVGTLIPVLYNPNDAPGSVEFVGDSSGLVTIVSEGGYKKIANPGVMVLLWKTAANTWNLVGRVMA